MPIICLEGASAVGKTTTANKIAKNSNSYIIPEVNLLFERPKEEGKTWYLERQVERWQIAQLKIKQYEVVILDGDIFQPLSYSWCFNFSIFDQSLDFIYEFYREEIKAGKINFPDKYYYLYTTKANLRYRKENDFERNRGNFEKHLDIIEPHRRYYESLNQFVYDYVKLIDAEKIDDNIKEIFRLMPSHGFSVNSGDLLNEIKNWLTSNKT